MSAAETTLEPTAQDFRRAAENDRNLAIDCRTVAQRLRSVNHDAEAARRMEDLAEYQDRLAACHDWLAGRMERDERREKAS